MKECFGFGYMNRHGDAQPPALLPDRIEPRVVYRNQLACLVLHSEAQILQHLQPASASRDRAVKLRHHFLAEFRIIDLGPVDLTEHDEPPGIRLNHCVDDFLKLLAQHASQDYNCFDVGFIHDFDDTLRRYWLIDSLSVVHVVMNVNDIKLRAFNFVYGRVQHRYRMEVFQQKRLFLLCIFGRLVADLRRRSLTCGLIARLSTAGTNQTGQQKKEACSHTINLAMTLSNACYFNFNLSGILRLLNASLTP